MFTVVIPLYNKELSVTSTINSVLNQTIQDFELLIINDGSTDNSKLKVKAFQDSRIRVFDKKNEGVSSARNIGIKNAQYEWIAFLDADDLWNENHLEVISNLINMYPGEKVFATSYILSDGTKIPVDYFNREDSIIHNYYEISSAYSILCSSNVVINKTCFQNIGGFKEFLSYGEDLDMWDRLASEYNIVKSKKITATYRIDAENRSNTSKDIKKSRVFHYDLSEVKNKDEFEYYKINITKVLLGRLLNGKFRDFFKLKNKHKKHISYIFILKSFMNKCKSKFTIN